MKVSLLDYGAGNVRSVRNAIVAAGYNDIEDIVSAEQILAAECIVFPGVGSYQTAMQVLTERGFVEPLRAYLRARDRPFLGICLGMQTLFESSEERGGRDDSDDDDDSGGQVKVIQGLGVIPGKVVKFDKAKLRAAVPHIGWNGRILHQDSPVLRTIGLADETYFVHSYYAELTEANADWVLTSTVYGDQRFISAVQSKCVVATQFHPEKSGMTGLKIMKGFLEVRTING